MSLALADLQNFLTGADLGPPVLINRLPDQPDEAIVALAIGGTSPILDGAFERSHVQIRSRADTDALAEALALSAHAFLSAHETSFQMGTTYVMSIWPQGPPTYFDRDVDNRSVYAASYEFTVAV